MKVDVDVWLNTDYLISCDTVLITGTVALEIKFAVTESFTAKVDTDDTIAIDILSQGSFCY